MFYRRGMAAAGATLLAVGLWAQNQSELEKNQGVGDSPDVELGRATDLRPDLTHAAVRAAMRKVADWQLERVRPYFSDDWTFAALYDGFMAASATLGDPKYQQAMWEMGVKLKWQPGKRPEHADDVAVGQTYLELYLKKKDPRILPPLIARFAYQMTLKDDPAKPIWWWCDALFMAPPTLARLYKATGNSGIPGFPGPRVVDHFQAAIRSGMSISISATPVTSTSAKPMGARSSGRGATAG